MVSLGFLLLAVAVLLPVINRAQRSAGAVRCSWNLRVLIEGVRMYAMHNNGALPGSPWTNGTELTGGGQPMAGVQLMTTRASRSARALTPFDWVTPVVEEISPGTLRPDAPRADRWAAMMSLKTLRCPENRLRISPLDDPTAPVLPAPSYVTNLDFLLVSSRLPPPDGGMAEREGLRVSAAPVSLPMYYSPRLERKRLGDLSVKAFLVEWMNPRLVVSPRLAYPGRELTGQDFGGMFASVRMYAVRARWDDPPAVFLTGNDADPTIPPEAQRLPGEDHRGRLGAVPWGAGKSGSNPGDEAESMLLLVARHGSSRADDALTQYRLNFAFLDGHVATLPVLEAMNPTYHSPKGTEIEIRREWVYPRVILRHMEGKEGGVYTVR
jgi:prepilin-type processing-associated H-X9-DG protein